MRTITYKLRSECIQDCLDLIALMNDGINVLSLIKMERIPDCELVFISQYSKEELITLMESIEDSHVMRETINPLEDYTGDRRYDQE